MSKIILTLVLLPFFLFSQQTAKQGIDFGVYLQPEMNGIHIPYPLEAETSTKSKLGLSAGVNIEIPLNRRISLRGAAGIGLKNYEHALYFTVVEDSPQGFVFSKGSQVFKMLYCEAQLPLLFQYKIKNRFLFCGGVDLNLSWTGWSKNLIYLPNRDVINGHYPSGAKLNFAPVVSAGYLIPMTAFSHLLIEPVFKYYLRQIIAIPRMHLYNYGIRFTYNFL